MPTYEYECRKCGHRFDAFQSMSDEPLSECPECSGRVQRLIGAGAGIIFKGSGFYATDSRKSSSKASKSDGDSKGGNGAKSESASKSESSSESSSGKSSDSTSNGSKKKST